MNEGGIIIEIKQIRLSPKKGGNGFVSSFSVNIGSNEAKECGLIGEHGADVVVIKLVDKDKQEITIRRKSCTLTYELVDSVIRKAAILNRCHRDLTNSLPHDGDIINAADIPTIFMDTDNEYINRVRDVTKELENYLLSLPLETITDLMTLMYMGRDRDADMKLSPADRFTDYWSYLASCGCLADNAYNIVEHMLEKGPLPDYLRQGYEILMQPAQEDKTDQYDSEYDDY